jgi:hypothetical protein
MPIISRRSAKGPLGHFVKWGTFNEIDVRQGFGRRDHSLFGPWPRYFSAKVAWMGTLSHEGGAEVIKNPKKPVFGEGALNLVEELNIGKPGGKEGPLFSHMWSLAVDDEDNIYAMDQGETQVKVFNKKGTLLKTIGRKGTGPGELQNPNNIFISGGSELVVEDYIRNLTYYTPDGRYLRALSTVRIFPIGIFLDSSGRIFALRNMPNSGTPGKEIDLYDQNLNFLKTIVSVAQP